MSSVIVDRHGQSIERHLYDDLTDTLVIHKATDIEANIEANKREYRDNSHARFGDLKKVASIPEDLMAKWIAEDGINYMKPEHAAALRRKLNDPDNRFLRTMPGKL